jgi:hypothetical protein
VIIHRVIADAAAGKRRLGKSVACATGLGQRENDDKWNRCSGLIT